MPFSPAGQTKELMFLGHRCLSIQFPDQDVDEMRVLNDNGNLFEHVFEGNVCLFQSADKR